MVQMNHEGPLGANQTEQSLPDVAEPLPLTS